MGKERVLRSIGLICALSVVLSGCAKKYYLPPSTDQRSKISRVGLVVTAPGLAAGPDTPTKGSGEGAASGAAQGALGSLGGGASACTVGDPLFCALGLALGIALAVPVGIGGAIVGASRAHTKEEVETAADNIRRALASQDIAAGIEAAMLSRAKQRLSVELISMKPADSQTAASTQTHMDVDTILEITPGNFGFISAGKIDPDLTLELSVAAVLIRKKEMSEIYRREWKYRSHGRNYFSLAADDAKALKTEIAASYRLLANQMIDDLFIAQHPKLATPVPPRGGTGVWTISAPSVTVEGDQPIPTIDEKKASNKAVPKSDAAPEKANNLSPTAKEMIKTAAIPNGELSSEQIRALLPGITIALPHTVRCDDFDNLGGDSCHLLHEFQHSNVIRSKTIGHSGSSRENGRWWIEGQKNLCLKWPSWFEGKQRCYSVIKAGGKVTLRGRDARSAVYLIEKN